MTCYFFHGEGESSFYMYLLRGVVSSLTYVFDQTVRTLDTQPTKTPDSASSRPADELHVSHEEQFEIFPELWSDTSAPWRPWCRWSLVGQDTAHDVSLLTSSLFLSAASLPSLLLLHCIDARHM